MAGLIVFAYWIGLPLTYFVMSSSLGRLAYRIAMNPIDFVLAVAL